VNPLAVRDFRLLSAGQLASTIGDFCYAIALPWYVLSSHGSAVLLGVVLAFYGVPRTALIPVGGVLSDRLSPRTVMLLADASRCVMVAVLVLLATRHTVSLVFLAPTAALIGAGEGLFSPRRSRYCRRCSTHPSSPRATGCSWHFSRPDR
jgi:MFS family permease